MDDELKLINGLWKAIERTDLDPSAVARCVEYIAERCYAERDAYEREQLEERKHEAEVVAEASVGRFQRLLAQAGGCQCPECQRARGERFDA